MSDTYDASDEAENRKDTKDDIPNMSEKTWKSILKDAAFWTAIFTGMLTLFTYMLYQVSKTTDETSRATQRAFLNFSNVAPIVGLIGPDKKRVAQQVSLNWTNSGSTPAKNAVTRGNVQQWQSDVPDGFDYKDLTGTEAVPLAVGPKETSGAPMIFGIDLLRSVREGKTRIFVWGWTVYDDIFPGDPPRLTEFCREIVQVAIPPDKDITDPTVPITWNYQQCKHHNCYDQDCRDYAAVVKEARPND